MIDLKKIESDLKDAMKAKNQIAVDVLRGLKTRIQNEQIAKIKELVEDEVIALIKSEIKKRKESKEAFLKGDRHEMAEKEGAEIVVLEKYLPEQLSEDVLLKNIEKLITENNWTAKDFGVAMGALKKQFGNSADGALIARLLKEKLKT